VFEAQIFIVQNAQTIVEADVRDELSGLLNVGIWVWCSFANQIRVINQLWHTVLLGELEKLLMSWHLSAAKNIRELSTFLLLFLGCLLLFLRFNLLWDWSLLMDLIIFAFLLLLQHLSHHFLHLLYLSSLIGNLWVRLSLLLTRWQLIFVSYVIWIIFFGFWGLLCWLSFLYLL
jgi:hypothetical protein